jgi:protein-tyrosine phosphatase
MRPSFSLLAALLSLTLSDRIPTPEGLAPPSLCSLDSHLSHIIDTYTLKGAPVLVHCRGGVGRAGLIACCWMLKLGLCGWIETDLRHRSTHNTASGRVDGEVSTCGLRKDTMQLVERAIGVVRRRRSVKAVETYEQVKFLVDFVEYLRVTSVVEEVL